MRRREERYGLCVIHYWSVEYIIDDWFGFRGRFVKVDLLNMSQLATLATCLRE